MGKSARLRAFEAWMRAQGITWDAKHIDLVESMPDCSGLSLGIVAVDDIAENSLLCVIPKAAVLSVRTTALAAVLESEKIGGGLGLTIAAAYEAGIGAASKWHGYFRALPAREYLPLFWTEAELQLLQGTDIEGTTPQEQADVEDDYATHVLPLLERHPEVCGAVSLAGFQAAASWVASRAFYVDEQHGDALVPLADVFNHKASVVELAEGYVVGEEADGGSASGGEDDGDGSGSGSGSGVAFEDGGELAGSGSEAAEDGEEGHDGGAGPRNSGQGGQESTEPQGGRPPRGAPPGGPWQAVGQAASGRAPIISDHAAGAWERHGVNLRLQIGICSVPEHGGPGGPDVLEIIAASAVPKGEEVHNTYGEKGNAELVKRYGFALRNNPFNEVALPKGALLEAAEAQYQRQGLSAGAAARQLRHRCRWLAAHSDVLSEDAEPFAALPHGSISTPLFLALRTLCAPADVFDGWHNAADVLDGCIASRPTDGATTEGQTAAAGSAVADRFAEVAIGGQLDAWSPNMFELLEALLSERLAVYPPDADVAFDEAAVARLRGQSTEAAAAKRAALMLRLTEMDILQQALGAVRRCSARPGEPKSKRRRGLRL